MFTLTGLSTSRMPSCLEAFFFPLSASGNWGGGGGGGGGKHAFFHRIFFDDYVFSHLFLPFSDFSADLGIGCSISLPLLKVIMAWTLSIFGVGSLV